MGYEARIILDSVGPNGARLTTFELTYPRFVHAELMTHRVVSRNSASSRAIPTDKLLERIQQDPVMPVWWGKNQAGMQAREQLDAQQCYDAKVAWVSARDAMLTYAARLRSTGLHKQIANRVLEPWMFITVLVTATEFSNFFGLRVDPNAQPELRETVEKALRLYEDNEPRVLEAGRWHTPLVTGVDEEELAAKGYAELDRCQISVGRCARVSYLTHEGKRDPEADVALMRGLVGNGHMSPLEHVAQALSAEQWTELGGDMMERWVHDRVPSGNLWGWKQYRKVIEGEHDFAKLKAEREANLKSAAGT